MFDPLKTSVVICGTSQLSVAPELLFWLNDIGVPRRSILMLAGHEREASCVYNRAMALHRKSSAEFCITSDADMRPELESTNPILSLPFDATCARSDTECGEKSWVTPSCFHTGMWIMRRDVLTKVVGPWFKWSMDDLMTTITGCMCGHFVKKLRASGFTAGYAGYAKHYPRGHKEIPTMVRYRDPDRIMEQARDK